MGLVTTYMCSAACKGTCTPHSRPISLAHMPPQLTTTSQAMSPELVDTPATALCLWRIAVTLTFSKMRAPRSVAPLAMAKAVLLGTVCPSSGIKNPAHEVIGAHHGP